MIRVIVADDHHLVRQGIRALLEKAGDIQVIGEAGDGQEAVELVEQLSPDVLVLDVAMPRMDGIQATERIQALDTFTRVVILSMYSDKALVRRALQSGARGYLLKHSVTEELLLAIRAATRGEIYLSPEISKSMVADFLQTETEPPQQDLQLTTRELEVLQLVSEGHTNRSIGETLHVSVKTVEKHRANLMAKLEVNDLAGLIRVAIKRGLVILDN